MKHYSDSVLLAYHEKLARHLLTAAAHEGADVLVLGAFGCGVFLNSPDIVAKAYKNAIADFPKVFEHIEFAVYCKPDNMKNYTEFSRILNPKE